MVIFYTRYIEPMNFEVSVIDSVEALEQFVPEWLAFQETEPCGFTAFNDPRYIIARWKAKNLSPEEESQHAIIIVRDSGKICCIAPFWSRRDSFPIEFGFKKVWSIKIRQLECYGDSFIFCDKGNENNVMFDIVFKTLRQRFPRFDILYMMDIRLNSPFWDYCNRKRLATGIRVRKTFQTPQTVYRIRLGDSMDALMASLDKKQRYSVRRTVKRYHEEQSENCFVKITKPEQVEFLSQAMQQISSSAWQSTAFGTGSMDSEQNCFFFKELALQGVLRSYILQRNGIPIAYRAGIQAGKYFSAMESRYNRAHYEKLYPGIVCLYKHIEELFQENRPEIFDFGLGDYGGYKSVWANDNIESMTLFLTGSFKGTTIVQTQAIINSIVTFGKKTLDRFGFKEMILNFFKGKLRSSKQTQYETNKSESEDDSAHPKRA